MISFQVPAIFDFDDEDTELPEEYTSSFLNYGSIELPNPQMGETFKSNTGVKKIVSRANEVYTIRAVPSQVDRHSVTVTLTFELSETQVFTAQAFFIGVAAGSYMGMTDQYGQKWAAILLNTTLDATRSRTGYFLTDTTSAGNEHIFTLPITIKRWRLSLPAEGI